MKNKGFTLIELLAAIVIIGIMLAIIVINFSGIFTNVQDRVYKSYEDSMKTATIQYMVDTGDVPSSNSDLKISLSYLVGEDGRKNPLTGNMEKANPPYLDYFKNPSSNDKCIQDSYVKVQYVSNGTTDENGYVDNNKKYEYKVCLKCDNYESEVCTGKCTDPNKKAKIIFHYLEEGTDRNIIPPVTMTGNCGYNYGDFPMSFASAIYVRYDEEHDPPNGRIDKEEINVFYYYRFPKTDVYTIDYDKKKN